MLKIIKKIRLFLLLFILAGIIPYANSKTIIWDLDGVLFRIDKTAIMYDLGLNNIFKYMFFDWKSPYIEPVIFKVLEAYGGKQLGHEEHFLRGHNNEPLPAIMLDWQIGKKSGYQIIEELLRFINLPGQENLFVSEYEKVLVEQAIKVMFDPYRLQSYTRLINPGLQLLEEIASQKNQNGQNRHNLIILSNRDADSFALLKSAFPEVFKFFSDSKIIVSAHIGLAKPSPLAFEYILNEFNLSPEECIFLDDQMVNIDSAKALGINAIQVKDSKFPKVRKELKSLGII